MPPAKLGIILQTLFIFLINLRFPHPSLLTSLLMGYIRSLQSDTVVRALAVIEVDKSSYMLQSLLILALGTDTVLIPKVWLLKQYLSQ